MEPEQKLTGLTVFGIEDHARLRRTIQEEYTEVAANPKKGSYFHTGRPLARILEYPDEWLDDIPESSIESFSGTGNPFHMSELAPGQRVVDVGSGAGLDCLIAAKKVGPYGQVIGIDMTQAMLDKAGHAAREAGLANVEFREGYAEALPVEDGWADVVISNGVLTLIPDKAAVLEEMFRVLKAGGQVQIGDVVRQKADLWHAALREVELKAEVVTAGFVGFEITRRKDVFSGTPLADSTYTFGPVGITFQARKAPNDEAS